MNTVDKWISIDGAAEYLDVSSVTIYRWLEKGRIPGHRVGRQWRFKLSEIDEWVRSGSAADQLADQEVKIVNLVDNEE
ncbi:MAG: helix-turn-helix domain-containing protein [Legionellaceae bacterium]|nr:helix-turn-helix domain-containing protein [Legionellaceae bacterium]MBP9774805.1 helix-turn-helix domain-containing protein [Legionellaceae bacterium]